MSAFMDAIPFWGSTGVLGQSDSMVHITQYSIYSKTDLFLINYIVVQAKL